MLKNNTYADVSTGSLSSDFRVDTNAYTLKDGTIPTQAVIPSLVLGQVSHEFKLSGTALDESIDYIVGVYSFQEDAINEQPCHLEFTGLKFLLGRTFYSSAHGARIADKDPRIQVKCAGFGVASCGNDTEGVGRAKVCRCYVEL
jgi:hypothetical protein